PTDTPAAGHGTGIRARRNCWRCGPGKGRQASRTPGTGLLRHLSRTSSPLTFPADTPDVTRSTRVTPATSAPADLYLQALRLAETEPPGQRSREPRRGRVDRAARRDSSRRAGAAGQTAAAVLAAARDRDHLLPPRSRLADRAGTAAAAGSGQGASGLGPGLHRLQRRGVVLFPGHRLEPRPGRRHRPCRRRGLLRGAGHRRHVGVAPGSPSSPWAPPRPAPGPWPSPPRGGGPAVPATRPSQPPPPAAHSSLPDEPA